MHPMRALFERNAWANERLLDFCELQPAAILSAPAEADVMGPIDAQLTHIVNGEAVILRWVTGERRPEFSLDPAPPLADLRAPMHQLAEQWALALDSDRDPEAKYQFQGSTRTVDMTVWKAVLQFLHHGDDHRAQIGTQLGRLGVEGPEVDLWAFGEAVGFERPDTDPGKRMRRDAVLRRAFGHHTWATETLLARCMELSPEQLRLSAPGTYGSILDTLDHMISSNRSYLSRLQGTGRKPPLQAGALQPLLGEFQRTSEGWLGYLASQPDYDAAIDMRDGTKVGAWVIVAQAIHHGNDHRTHVTTTLMHNGLPIPDLDGWEYAKAVGAQTAPA